MQYLYVDVFGQNLLYGSVVVQESLTARLWPATYWVAVCLFGLLTVGFWLRWQFIHNVSLDVDEYTTLWASRRILETGIPSMPSGVVYTRGLLNMYITALFGAVGGLNAIVGRLPSLFFGLATITILFLQSKQIWNRRVGWLATLVLVLHPESIKWDSFARFYAQLVFFSLLTTWSAFQLARAGENPAVDQRRVWRDHLFFALFFVLALFSQEETILFYPALVIGLLWWRGWRYFLQPPAITAQLICLGAMALRYLFEILGQPGYFSAMQAHKSYIDPNAGWYAIEHLFLPILPPAWLVLVPLAVIITLWQLRQVQWRPTRLPLFHQATLFLLVEFLVMALLLIFVVGIQWQAKRFGLMLQPWWLLAGAAGATWLVDRISTHWVWRWLTTLGLSLLIILPLWPLAQRLVVRPGEGYDAVFAYVAAHRQPDDVIMTPQPPVCVFVLGKPCDYYARERDYEPYVIERNGILVDRWSGAPLLDSASQLAAVIQRAPQVWFITDRERLSTRYQDQFLRTIVEQFDVVFEERDVLALVARGWSQPPAYTEPRTPNKPVALGPLRLKSWERDQPVPGAMFHTMLSWQLTAVIDEPVHTSLQLVRSDGLRIAQADGALADGLATTDELLRVALPDYKALLLPADLSPGRYRLEVIAYTVADGAPLADPIALDWLTIGPPPPLPMQASDAQWQAGLHLLGHDALPATLAAQSSFVARLVWSTAAPQPEDYTVFVHLLGPDDTIVAQNDRQPLAGFYPTSGWAVDDLVEDQYAIAVPDSLPAGQYRLVAGWYLPVTGSRLPLADGSDAIEIAQWTVP